MHLSRARRLFHIPPPMSNRTSYQASLVNLSISALLVLGGCAGTEAGAPPNVLLIEAQGIGYSDIGAYGSEIHTPHLDSLASLGVRFTQFYGDLRASPVYASASAGCGGDRLLDPEASPSSVPGDFRLHRSGRVRREPSLPQSTVATSEALDQLDLHVANHAQNPFLLHVAYDPLPSQQPRIDLPEAARYRGRYSGGWQVLRRERFARMLALGLIDERYQLPPLDSIEMASHDPAGAAIWMEQYAALVERMDSDLGKLLARLQTLDLDQETLVLFVATGTDREGLAQSHTPRGWSYAAGTPYRQQAGVLFEGALKRALIAYWPGGITSPGRISTHVSRTRDVEATVLALAGVPYGGHSRGCGLPGKSLERIFRGTSVAGDDTLYWASEDGGAVRLGRWKLVGLTTPAERWMLFDLSKDPTEMNDLSSTAGERVNHLRTSWHSWVARSSD